MKHPVPWAVPSGAAYHGAGVGGVGKADQAGARPAKDEELRMKGTDVTDKQIAIPAGYTCVVCGLQEPWSAGWAEYTSIGMRDDGCPGVFTCSKACRKQIEGKEEQALADYWAEIEFASPHPQFKAHRIQLPTPNPKYPAWKAKP